MDEGRTKQILREQVALRELTGTDWDSVDAGARYTTEVETDDIGLRVSVTYDGSAGWDARCDLNDRLDDRYENGGPEVAVRALFGMMKGDVLEFYKGLGGHDVGELTAKVGRLQALNAQQGRMLGEADRVAGLEEVVISRNVCISELRNKIRALEESLDHEKKSNEKIATGPDALVLEAIGKAGLKYGRFTEESTTSFIKRMYERREYLAKELKKADPELVQLKETLRREKAYSKNREENIENLRGQLGRSFDEFDKLKETLYEERLHTDALNLNLDGVEAERDELREINQKLGQCLEIGKETESKKEELKEVEAEVEGLKRRFVQALAPKLRYFIVDGRGMVVCYALKESGEYDAKR